MIRLALFAALWTACVGFTAWQVGYDAGYVEGAADATRATCARLPGDCNADGQLTFEEQALAWAVEAGVSPPRACLAADIDGDGLVEIEEAEMISWLAGVQAKRGTVWGGEAR
jgi:hypothetical protein